MLTADAADIMKARQHLVTREPGYSYRNKGGDETERASRVQEQRLQRDQHQRDRADNRDCRSIRKDDPRRRPP